MKHIADFMRHPTEFFKDERNQKILTISVFVLLFLYSLILLSRSISRRGEESLNMENALATSVPMTSTITPTKWWIKITATPLHIPSQLTTSIDPAGSSEHNCPMQFSSPLKAETYAYISPTPPLPNRIRSGAGLSNSYLGQIEPGDGLRLIDGPICADGFSWWFVESLHGDLRGWTVEGKISEQWVIPCPNENVACSQAAVPATSSIAPNTDTAKDNNKNLCQSDKLSNGMFVQVGQDSLLVIRSEPYAGGVIGRAGPMSIAMVLEGPACAGDSVWWKLNVRNLDLVGWATENELYACPKDSECNLSPN